MSDEKNIPDGWVETTLGNIVNLGNNKIDISKITKGNYVSTENLLTDRKGIINATSLPTIPKVNKFQIGDTLFSNIRTYFKKVWFSDKIGGSSNDVIIFSTKNENSLAKKFLFYLISSDLFIDFTVKSAKGTKMPRGDKDAIKTFNILLPSLPEQKAIADILTAFDDKIENLQAQNKTLETIAQTIFKEWFGKYQIGDELPEGWRVGKLGEVGTIITGKTPSKNNPDYWGEKYSFITPTDFKEFGMYATKTHRNLSLNGWVKMKKNQLPLNTIMVTCIGSDMGKIAISSKECITNQQLNSIILFHDIHLGFVYQYLKSQHTKLKNIAMGGSTMPIINKTTFSNIELLIPADILTKKYQEMWNPISAKILQNVNQIQTLKKTRDTLLPKLMNGTIRVKK